MFFDENREADTGKLFLRMARLVKYSDPSFFSIFIPLLRYLNEIISF